MSQEIAKRVAAIHAGETFMTCKGCRHWDGGPGATAAYCLKNSYSPAGSPVGFHTRTIPVRMSGCVNGDVTLHYTQSALPHEYIVTTDLQCCSDWEERK